MKATESTPEPDLPQVSLFPFWTWAWISDATLTSGQSFPGKKPAMAAGADGSTGDPASSGHRGRRDAGSRSRVDPCRGDALFWPRSACARNLRHLSRTIRGWIGRGPLPPACAFSVRNHGRRSAISSAPPSSRSCRSNRSTTSCDMLLGLKWGKVFTRFRMPRDSPSPRKPSCGPAASVFAPAIFLSRRGRLPPERFRWSGSRICPPEARETLMQIQGVGEKVANCILLFAYGRSEAFPIDVWVERVLRRLYFNNSQRVTHERLRAFAENHFGPQRGYAQQFLFHWIRKDPKALPTSEKAARKSIPKKSPVGRRRQARPAASRKVMQPTKRSDQSRFGLRLDGRLLFSGRATDSA